MFENEMFFFLSLRTFVLCVIEKNEVKKRCSKTCVKKYLSWFAMVYKARDREHKTSWIKVIYHRTSSDILYTMLINNLNSQKTCALKKKIELGSYVNNNITRPRLLMTFCKDIDKSDFAYASNNPIYYSNEHTKKNSIQWNKTNDKKVDNSIMIKSIFKLNYEVLTEPQESRNDVASVRLK